LIAELSAMKNRRGFHSSVFKAMIINSLLIVADRGSLKAYKVEEMPTRAPRLRLIQAFDTLDVHGRYQDKVTDQAGGFPSGGGGDGRHANGIAERGAIDLENQRRACKHLAERISELVEQEKPEGWMIAAPAQSCPVISEYLTPAVRERLVESVHADLVKIEPAKLHSYFRNLQGA
jgi:hypothetical protein